MEMKPVKTECSYCNKPASDGRELMKIKKRYGDGELVGIFHADCGKRVLDGIDATIAMAGA
jgi:hypothetical protein